MAGELKGMSFQAKSCGRGRKAGVVGEERLLQMDVRGLWKEVWKNGAEA